MTIVKTLRKALGESSLHHFVRRLRYAREYRAWNAGHKSLPIPHLLKQRVVRQYADAYGARILVETGTYLGDMLFAMQDAFDALYSIELSDALFQRARRRFAKVPHIHLYHGDSSEVLQHVLEQVDQRCVFWLDGHTSGGITAKGNKNTPIQDELKHIFKHAVADHVILVDDGRLFTGEADYPALHDVRALVSEQRPDWSVELIDDIIRIAPSSKRL